jgi:PAS domain S-box-containing protein
MTKATLKTDSYKNIIQNKKLLELINDIISSFPFTYINLEQIRKQTDEFDEMFWIKDEEGKYLLANKKFATCLGLSPQQIEGKTVETFIPDYQIGFNRALDNYIKESANTLVVEGIPLSGLPSGENYRTVEIPITGTEGNVAAVICVAQKVEPGAIQKTGISSLNIIKSLNLPFVFINENETIFDLNDEFAGYFSLDKSSVLNSSFKDRLPYFLVKPAEEFITSGKMLDKTETKDEQKKFLVYFIKAEDSGEKGIIIILADKESEKPGAAVNAEINIPDILVRNIPDAVFIYDKENLYFLHANKAALSLYGYKRDEFLQLDLTDLYAPENIQTLLDSVEDKLGEDLFSDPYCHKRKDGTSVYVIMSKIKIMYKGREAVLTITRNVTDELKLAQESQQFKAAFENTGDLFFVTDKDGFIKSVSRSVVEELGYSARSLEESSFSSLVAEDDRAKINTTIFQKKLSEKISHKTLLKKAGNEQVNAELIFVPIFNFRNEVEFYNIIAKPESKIREVIKEVPANDVSIEAQENINPDAAFLAAVFHELLTPVNVILGFVQELTENIENPTKEQKEAVEIINQNRDYLINSMNSALEFNSYLKNKIKIETESVKITDIVEEIRKEIKEVELAYGKISSSLVVKTERRKLKHLFSLLLHISSATSQEKKIYFSAAPVQEDFIVNLRDNYSGISEKMLNKLNEIFGQEKALMHQQSGLSFLDIRLSKSLLKVLGGKFRIITEGNIRDAGFIFPLELKPEQEKAGQESYEEIFEDEEFISEQTERTFEEEEPADEIAEEGKEFQIRQSNVDLSQLSCLYIEDGTDSQTLLAGQMKDLKEIKYASDFEQALPFIQENRFDFIIVDINLPGDYNGLDVLKILRRMPGYENVPVIAVTAYLIPGDTEKFIYAGFNDFISKPVMREKLLASLEKLFLPQT